MESPGRAAGTKTSVIVEPSVEWGRGVRSASGDPFAVYVEVTHVPSLVPVLLALVLVLFLGRRLASLAEQIAGLAFAEVWDDNSPEILGKPRVSMRGNFNPSED